MPAVSTQLDLFKDPALEGFPYYSLDLGSPLTGTYPGISKSASPSPSVFGQSAICRHCGCSGDSCLSRSGDRCELIPSTNPNELCCTAEACRAKEMRRAANLLTRLPNPPTPRLRHCGCAVCSGRDRGYCRG